MIFEELIIHNYGIYKGRHIVNLRPKSRNKPIVLFGGLNGGGKTTFLDALKLTLYGKFANCSNRGKLTYQDYLRETINRHAAPDEGASLELKFTTYIDGELNHYQVRRFWQSTGKTIKEDMEIIHNGALDSIMTEQWYDYVNEFIPLNISGLFFFDGEKIETLADPENSSDLIRTGISSLLGLDIIDKLNSDLTALIRSDVKKHAQSTHDSNASNLIIENEIRLKELIQRQSGLNINLANSRSQLENTESEIYRLKKNYQDLGGELFDQRESLETQEKDLSHRLVCAEEKLRNISEGAAPMALVQDLLWKTKEQALQEAEGQRTMASIDDLKKRDIFLLKKLKREKADKATICLVEDILKEDNLKRKSKVPEVFYINAPPEAFEGLTPELFKSIKKETSKLSKEISTIREQLILVERSLAAVPEQALLADIQKQLNLAEDKKVKEKAKIDIIEEQINIVDRQIEQAELRLTNIKINNKQKSFDAEIQDRIIVNAGDVKGILKTFHNAMVKKHISHLEALIYESFISLIRKTDLVTKIKINSEDFSLILLDLTLNPIPATRLSAGERQILAISILWGLAKASGKPLPAIIDTPLGRLDSHHRQHLVDSYFPKASHQVILLSTDQEIDQAYRDDLSKYIGREYHIEYQEAELTSTISEGYF